MVVAVREGGGLAPAKSIAVESVAAKSLTVAANFKLPQAQNIYNGRVNIAALVTRRLGAPDKPTSPQDIISNNEQASLEVILDLIYEAQNALEKGSKDLWQIVTTMLAYQITSDLFGSKKLNVLVILHTREASLGKQQSVRWLRQQLEEAESEALDIARRRKRDDRVGSFAKATDFLVEILGDDAVAFLSDVTGVQIATARRWTKGLGARKKNAFTVYSVATALFALNERWGAQGLCAWMYLPLECGESPRELWVGFQQRTRPELQEELRRLELI